jgi:hypothetical protein
MTSLEIRADKPLLRWHEATWFGLGLGIAITLPIIAMLAHYFNFYFSNIYGVYAIVGAALVILLSTTRLSIRIDEGSPPVLYRVTTWFGIYKSIEITPLENIVWVQIRNQSGRYRFLVVEVGTRGYIVFRAAVSPAPTFVAASSRHP